MLEIILIRHGQTDWNKERRVMGARPVHLNALGKKQATELGRVLEAISLDAVYASPLLRTLQTARLLVRGRSFKIELAAAVQEIDYGQWVGKTFDEVRGDRSFQVYHKTPSKAQAPQGEKMTDVFKRAIQFIEGLRKKFKSGRVVVVSHADVIRLILVHYLELGIDDLLRLRIDNGSLSLLGFEGDRARVLAVNCPPTLPWLFEDLRS